MTPDRAQIEAGVVARQGGDPMRREHEGGRLNAAGAIGPKAGRLALAGLALLALSGAASAASAGELLIEQRVADDGALLVRYVPPAGVRELPLFQRSGAIATVWGEMAQPVDRCGAVSLTPRPTITLAPGCTEASFRIAPRVLRRYATYEPAFPVGPDAVMGYTSYYASAVRGHALHWRWTPGEGASVVVAGRLSAGTVDREIAAEQVDRSIEDEGRTASGFSGLGANEYVFLGRADTVPLPGGVLIHDRVLDAARLDAVRATLGAVTERLGRAYGVMPAAPWAVVASAAPNLPGFHGDVTPGRMMSVRFNETPPKDIGAAVNRTRRFVAHEATHWWDTGIYETDRDRAWIHEGHADWMAGLLMIEAGALGVPQWREDMDVALNTCLYVRGDRPAVSLPAGHGRDDDPYACGQALMLLAQVSHAARVRGESPVDASASLFRGSTAPIDAAAVARWADGGEGDSAASGPMHRLLFDPQLGFSSAIKRDWRDLIEVSPLKPGEPVPSSIKGRMAAKLMQTLMEADCGTVGFWTNADHFLIEDKPGCRVLRGDMKVRRLAGVSPFEDPVGAWQAARAACAASRPIEITIDGEPTKLACPAAMPDMPIHEILRLRPQAAARLGLGT